MEEFNALITQLQDATNVFTAQDLILTLVLSFALSVIIAYTYRGTYHGASYSQSFVQTLVLVSMVVAIIMLIVGSNIARAFTLVGALSIIRFRNAVKETRDVGFIFFAMAIGMACGTRFYFLAVIATLMISLLVWVMVRLDMFAADNKEQILKVRLPADVPSGTVFDQLFSRYLARYNLIAIESVQAGMLTEYVYGVEFKKGADSQAFITDIRQLNQNNKVVLITGQQEVNL